MTKKDKGEEMRVRSNSNEHSLPSLSFPTYLFTFHIPPLPPSLSYTHTQTHAHTHPSTYAHPSTEGKSCQNSVSVSVYGCCNQFF